MSIWTHSFRYTSTASPSNSEDRVLAGNRFTDDAHCVINSLGYIGYYIDGVFTQMGSKAIEQSKSYSIIIVHDDSGNGAIYLGGQKLGQVTNFPKSAINQIGNFATGLRAEDGRRPHDRLRPRDEGSLWTRPCLGTIDELIRFDRALSSAEIVDLAQNGTISKTFGLADYYVQAAADDGKISPIEKPTERSYWIRLWKEDQRTSPLPTEFASITVDGEYKALATAANEAKIWTPTTVGTSAYSYYLAIESWRKMLFDSSVSGFLLTANLNSVSDISGISPDYDTRLAALVSSEKNFQNAIINAKGMSEEAIQEIIINKTPQYRGTISTVPNGADCVIMKGPATGNVTVNQGDWILMVNSGTNYQQGYCYYWSGVLWVYMDPLKYSAEYQAALYDIMSISDLMSNTGFFGALFAKQIMSLQATINELQTKVITLQNAGKIQSSNFKSGSSGFQVKADGGAEFNNVVVRGEVHASSGEFTGTVNANAGKFSGEVNASAGNFCGLTISENSFGWLSIKYKVPLLQIFAHVGFSCIAGQVFMDGNCSNVSTVRRIDTGRYLIYPDVYVFGTTNDYVVLGTASDSADGRGLILVSGKWNVGLDGANVIFRDNNTDGFVDPDHADLFFIQI